jgi:hypothetical protein
MAIICMRMTHRHSGQSDLVIRLVPKSIRGYVRVKVVPSEKRFVTEIGFGPTGHTQSRPGQKDQYADRLHIIGLCGESDTQMWIPTLPFRADTPSARVQPQ